MINQTFKGYRILSAELVKSPTKKPYEHLVILCPDGTCLSDGWPSVGVARAVITQLEQERLQASATSLSRPTNASSKALSVIRGCMSHRSDTLAAR
jgi:hypothetical protein